MINGKSAIGIIPARGGSKGLPGKNIRPLCGKPLLAWSIEKARKSAFLDEVMVTTDDPQIGEIARRLGASVPFLRPVELAADDSPMVETVEHVLTYYRGSLRKSFDYIVLLEPTSPLREDGDIDSMLKGLDEQADQFDSIISIGEIAEHPSIVKRIHEGILLPFAEGLKHSSRRQDNPAAFFPYGVAYIVKSSAFSSERTFYTKRSTYFVIQRYQCFEIDDLYDFLAVEAVMKHQWGIQ